MNELRILFIDNPGSETVWDEVPGRISVVQSVSDASSQADKGIDALVLRREIARADSQKAFISLVNLCRAKKPHCFIVVRRGAVSDEIAALLADWVDVWFEDLKDLIPILYLIPQRIAEKEKAAREALDTVLADVMHQPWEITKQRLSDYEWMIDEAWWLDEAGKNDRKRNVMTVVITNAALMGDTETVELLKLRYYALGGTLPELVDHAYARGGGHILSETIDQTKR